MAQPETRSQPDAPAVAAIRRFNRFHTRWVGALGGSLHGSGFALTEARVLYELAQRDGLMASELARDLGLDPAYLSRILKRFAAQGWLGRERSSQDGRAQRLSLTPLGRAAFAPLDRASPAVVSPEARGLGLGKRLVAEAVGFAREAGYARMVLWTNDILHAARAIYVAQGFKLVAEERHHSFGQDLVGQNWELEI